MLVFVLGVSLLLAGQAAPDATVAIHPGVGEADTIVVLSAAGRTLDQFRGWKASVSSDGRFVAYADYADASATAFRIVIYDVSAAARNPQRNAGSSVYPQDGPSGALHSPLVWIDGRRLAFLDASDSNARVVLIDVNDDASSMGLHTRDLQLSQIVIGELLRPGQTPGSVVFVDAITTYRANEEGTGITLHLVDGPAIDGESVSFVVK
jgi:hypothetical protein